MGGDVNLATGDGTTILELILKNGWTELCETVVQNKANLFYIDCKDYDYFSIGLLYKSYDCIRILLKNEGFLSFIKNRECNIYYLVYYWKSIFSF